MENSFNDYAEDGSQSDNAPNDNAPIEEAQLVGESSGVPVGATEQAAMPEFDSAGVVVDGQPADGFYRVDPRLITTDRISSAIFTTVVFVGAVVGSIVWWLTDGTSVWFYSALAAAIVLLLILLWATIAWPGISYRHTFWRLNDVGLEIRRGVWWKHQIAVPWARVQHADVSQGPLQRMFGLGSLTIHTAGTSDSSVTIEGLEHETALGIRDEIIRQRKHDVV